MQCDLVLASKTKIANADVYSSIYATFVDTFSRVAGLPPIPFALGFSVFVISIVLLGLSNLSRQEA